MRIRRCNVLLGGTAIAAAGGVPAPAIAQGIKELKMVTSWTIELQPGWGESADRLAQSITAMSDGRLKVTVYPANTLVRDFADTAAKDALTRRVYDSYMAFLAGVMDWGELSETGYRDTRRLALA